jgi:hypothetical protein
MRYACICRYLSTGRCDPKYGVDESDNIPDGGNRLIDLSSVEITR